MELFRYLGYQEVREVHGPNEIGKDLVCYEQNRMGELEFVGIQLKVGNIQGSASQSGNAMALLLQAVEALSSRILFGGESHYLDKYVIMASGTISGEARAKIHGFLRGNNKRVYIWGQEKIADVTVLYAPGFIRFPS